MQNFSPFPLRARGLLEIFDAAIKLYKQYFWVLLGWSAIVSSASIVGSLIPLGGFAGLFLSPLSIGSIICCTAAAVRGNNVEFGQCWRFTQPRYWTMLGMHLVASLLAFIVLGIVTAVVVGICVAGAFGLQSAELAVQIGAGILAFIVFGGILTLLGTVFFSWVSLVPIVICMEEDKRGTAALSRAYELLKGHWLRITSLMAIVGLGMAALLGILCGAAALIVGFGQIGDALQGRGGETTALWLGIATMGLAYIVLAMICTPLYYLILTVFYLDIRVRQEALDLEWTAHVTTPVATNETVLPGFIPTPSAPEYSASGFAPSGFSPSQLSPLQTPNSQDIPPAANPFGTRLLSDEHSTPLELSPNALETPPATDESKPLDNSTPPNQSPNQW